VTSGVGCVSGMSSKREYPIAAGNPLPTIDWYNYPAWCNGFNTGSVILNGFTFGRDMDTYSNSGQSDQLGTGATNTISNLAPGIYSFTVTNSAGCRSGSSAILKSMLQQGLL